MFPRKTPIFTDYKEKQKCLIFTTVRSKFVTPCYTILGKISNDQRHTGWSSAAGLERLAMESKFRKRMGETTTQALFAEVIFEGEVWRMVDGKKQAVSETIIAADDFFSVLSDKGLC